MAYTPSYKRPQITLLELVKQQKLKCPKDQLDNVEFFKALTHFNDPIPERTKPIIMYAEGDVPDWTDPESSRTSEAVYAYDVMGHLRHSYFQKEGPNALRETLTEMQERFPNLTFREYKLQSKP